MFRSALPSEEIFIAPLSWRPPIQLPCIPFKLIFPLLKTSPQSSPIIHLGQQIQCIASYIDLVEKMLYNSVEPRRYRYLPDSGMWYDSILKLKQDFTFNFDYLENTYKGEDKQPLDPNQLWTWMFYCYKGTSSHITYAKIISKHPQDTKDPLAFPSYCQKHACLHWTFCKKDYQYGLPWDDNNHCPFHNQTW